MCKLLLAAIAMIGFFTLTTSNASAAQVGLIVHAAPAYDMVTNVDYHRHWRHRRWHRAHWHH
jgi:hypothetical protein